MLTVLFVPLAAADGLAVASLAVEHLIAGNASELVVSESGVVVWRHGAAAGTAEGVTAVAALADGVRLSTVSGSYMVVAE